MRCPITEDFQESNQNLASFKCFLFLYKPLCDDVENYTEVNSSNYACMAEVYIASNLIQYSAVETSKYNSLCSSFGW